MIELPMYYTILHHEKSKGVTSLASCFTMFYLLLISELEREKESKGRRCYTITPITPKNIYSYGFSLACHLENLSKYTLSIYVFAN